MEWKIIGRDMRVLCSPSTDAPDSLPVDDSSGGQKINIVNGVATGTYDFITYTFHKDSKYIESGNYVAFVDKYNRHRLYTIMTVDGEDELDVHCEDIGIDLINEDTDSWDTTGNPETIEATLGRVLGDTGWTVGRNEIPDRKRATKYDSNTDTQLARVGMIMNSFEAECDFEIVLDGSKVVKQVVNIYKTLGEDKTQQRFIDEINLTALRRNESIEDLCTCVRCYGKEVDGKTTTIADIVYDDGRYYSPKGHIRIYDREARNKWSRFRAYNFEGQGEFLGYINGTFKYDTDSAQELFNRGLEELKSRNEKKVAYEASLYKLQADIGDAVQVASTRSGEPIYLSARVQSVTNHYTVNGEDTGVLANYTLLESNPSQSTSDLLEELKKQIVSVSGSTISYQIGISGTEPPTGDWQTTPIDPGTGMYLWTRTVTLYSDGSSTTAYSVSKNGADGEKGDKGDTGPQGIQGEKGEKGDTGERGLQGLQGPRGEQGIPGPRGADGLDSYFHIKYSPVSNPTAAQMTETPSKYIGTYVDNLPADSSDPSSYTWQQLEGSQGIQGEQGIAGPNGTDGKTSYLHIAYANSVDGKTGFSVSDSANKLYIGQYTDFVQNDSTDPTAYAWTKIKGETGAQGIQGLQGPQGEQGIQGPKGETGASGQNGVSVAGVTNFYKVSTSATGVTAPQSSGGRNLILNSSEYTKNTPYKLTPANDDMYVYLDNLKMTLVKGNTYVLQCNTDGIWSEHGVVGDKYCTIWIYGNDLHQCYGGNRAETGRKIWLINWTADTGEYGIRLNTYGAGNSTVSFWDMKIEKGNKATDWTPAPEDSGWSTTVPTLTATNKYLWNYEHITGSDDSTIAITKPRVIGAYGNTGATGATGNGISNITEYYQISTSNSTAPSSWLTTVPTLTATNKYLWNYEKITYTNGTSKDTLKRVIGVYGDKGATGNTGAAGPQGPQGVKGDTGAQGNTGATGNGIKSITEHYQASSSGSTAPTTWQSTPPLMTATNKYLWNYETITYTSGSSVDTLKRVIGIYGDKGATGATGAKGDTGATGPQGPQGNTGAQGPQGNTGATGNGIKSITNYYLATSAASGVEYSTSGWTTTVQAMTAAKKYLWNYEDVLYTSGTHYYSAPTIIGAYGDKGATGAQGPAGPQGATGAQGPQGIQGVKGDTGATGPQGPQGVKGDTGATGPQGATGPRGATGAKGDSGIIVSSTAPSSPTVGQLWQTASGQPIKRWNGSTWVLHYISVDNLDVATLSAITANIGTLTGNFESTLQLPSGGVDNVKGTTKIYEGLISGSYSLTNVSNSTGSFESGFNGIKGSAARLGMGSYSYEYGYNGIHVTNGAKSADLPVDKLRKLDLFADAPYEWKLLKEVSNTDFGSVIIADGYHEFLLTVGPFRSGDNGLNNRVLASIVIPISALVNTQGRSDANGMHQAFYNSSYWAGLNYAAANTIQIRASQAGAIARLWAR